MAGHKTCIFTARIRRMGEGNVLTCVCPSVCPQGGGQSSRGGQVSPAGGGVRSVQPGSGGSGQSSRGGGVRSVQLGGGSGQVSRGGGSVSWRGGWGEAKIGQQNEYSLHGGQYASCIHAGGLSCEHMLTFF